VFSLKDYNYDLSDELIAQKPVDQRDHSRLLFLHRETDALSHHRFYELLDLLFPSDLLVVNNTEVIPGRLIGNKDTGGKTEVLILNYTDDFSKKKDHVTFTSKCIIKASKRPKNGSLIFFDKGLQAEVLHFRDGIYEVRFSYNDNFESLLYSIGKVPLPPYIKRGSDNNICNDRTSYQTVYASQRGAVAAPTAGLHFSEELIEKLKSKGVKIVEVTLHVGYGSFLPVRVSDIRNHSMHSERFSISKDVADTINRTKEENNRIIAVGTTCVRTLEYASDISGKVSSGTGNCDLFIYPGYRFKVIDAMITNFHLPKSTLLMLVSAFAGRNKILEAYKEAINKGYRFYSYGDAMFIG